jgi:hypothetical protein
MKERFSGEMIIPVDAGGPSKSTCGFPDRQFEVDSTICVHFTGILTANRGRRLLSIGTRDRPEKVVVMTRAHSGGKP